MYISQLFPRLALFKIFLYSLSILKVDLFSGQCPDCAGLGCCCGFKQTAGALYSMHLGSQWGFKAGNIKAGGHKFEHEVVARLDLYYDSVRGNGLSMQLGS